MGGLLVPRGLVADGLVLIFVEDVKADMAVRLEEAVVSYSLRGGIDEVEEFSRQS